jgi:hypothetical protein
MSHTRALFLPNDKDADQDRNNTHSHSNYRQRAIGISNIAATSSNRNTTNNVVGRLCIVIISTRDFNLIH